ncbi:MAG: hypothetical protein ACTH31_01475 [Pseudoclavibacter sp.]
MPTLGDLPGEPSTERPEDDDEIPRRGRSGVFKLLAALVILGLAAPALIGIMRLLGG